MARGKRIDGEIREQAFALMATNHGAAYVADKLKIPYSTVKTWEKNWLSEAKRNADKGGGKKGKKNLEELRNEKKESFVFSAWRSIEKATNLLEHRIDRALFNEMALDKLLEIALDADISKLSQTEKNAICAKLASLKLESTRELSTVIGTLYDKQALANQEPTVNVGGELGLRKFEDM